MRRYFEHLKAERQAALKHTSDRSQSARYRRNYLLLMETQEVLSRPLERKMQLATIAVPVRRDAYLHYLWFLNSYARYLCYQCRRFRKAKAVLAKAFILSDKLFQMEFDRFQNQIRCFPLLIALNYARLSAISGNRDEASSQFHTLLNYLNDTDWENVSAFPKVVKEGLLHQRASIHNCLTRANRAFLLEKTHHSKNKRWPKKTARTRSKK